MTLEELVAEGQFLQSLLAEAKKEELLIKELIAIGGYSTLFAASSSELGKCVLKAPWLPPKDSDEHPQTVELGYGPLKIELVSPTGPFCLRGAKEGKTSEQLMTETADHQLQNPSQQLAKLLAVKTLGGRKCMLYERIEGNSLAWKIKYWPEEAKELIADLARALSELHASFGPHGDLKPEHVFLTKNGPIFIDPLLSTEWLGSVGYALPFMMPDNKLRDLAALAQMIAQMWGASFGWNGSLLYGLVNRGNGRFGRGFDLEKTEAQMLLLTEKIDEPIRQWVRDVGLSAWRKALKPGKKLYESEEKLEQLITMLPPAF